MKRKPAAKPKRTRATRRTPDARALEWAEKRLERAEKLHQWHTEKLQALHAEIPRLRGIIAALGPPEKPLAPASRITPGSEEERLRKYAAAQRPKPLVVAGMDVSRFVTPRAVVPEPIATDLSDEDSALLAAEANLPKGTPLGE